MKRRITDIKTPLAPECFPCFLRQALLALGAAGAKDELSIQVLKDAAAHVHRADPAETPSSASTPIHRRIRQMLGADPFKALKAEYNNYALALLPALRQKVQSSDDPLITAARLAIAGNVIDFGIYDQIDVEGTIRRALEEPMAVYDADAFREAVERADHVLYLLDNAGEAVLDMLLIEQLNSMGRRVTAVVRGAPIINDVTMEDARAIGLDALCRVMDNGSDAVGTELALAPPELREMFDAPGTLIISKGQGNFETLAGHGRQGIFFLFQAKCVVVARLLGLKVGDMLLASSGALL